MCIRDRGIEGQQHAEAEQQHAAGQPVGFSVFEGFNVVVDLHRDDAGPARDVAADHQNDAELTDRMGKAEDRTAQKSGSVQRHGHAPEGSPRAGAQRRGDFQRAFADGLEGILDGLYDKR